MSMLRLQPRSETLCVSRNFTVLTMQRDGFIHDGSDHGLFVHQTRLLSRYRYLINGQSPRPVVLSNLEQHSWLGYYILVPPGVRTNSFDPGSGQMDPVSEQTLELRLSRCVSDGMHEDVDLTNFTQQPTVFQLALEVDADFADQQETTHQRQQRGDLSREWRCLGDERWELAFDYHAEHEYDRQGNIGTARLHRGVVVQVRNAASPARYENGRIIFDIQLPPHGAWHACINVIPFLDGRWLPSLYACRSFGGTQNEFDRRRQAFLADSTAFTTPGSGTLSAVVTGALEQAKHDLAALRLYDLDRGERHWTMAAGLPIYAALFGRDALTTAWQAGMVSPAMMPGTLAAIADRQGTQWNDWRDEQPGRMLHEAHTGPLATLNFNPRRRSYGSVTTSAFYPVLVSELWHWTGSKELVQPFLEPALKGLRWLNEHSDLNGDGFYEYKTRSSQGVRNQGWKDSPGAIVHDDGSQVDPPIATCEEQGFAYLAKLHLAEVLWWFDRKDEAKRLYGEAGALKKRFNDAFWMADEGFIAMGLDAQSRPIRSISSNAGHCIATGIVEQPLVQRIADRLLRHDLFSGWGIRTLSSEHPAYNPYSYHRGSVWPVEQGTFALGFYRYGLHDQVERICRAQFEAAALFDFYRLPEVFSGHARDNDHPFPALYPQANTPQAWSASAVFCLLQAILGLYPYAPLRLLLLDPHLPAWLPEITLSNLHVGNAVVAIRFYRKPSGASSYEILDKQGSLHVLRQPSPWSLTAGFGERMVDVLASLLPGK